MDEVHAYNCWKRETRRKFANEMEAKIESMKEEQLREDKHRKTLEEAEIDAARKNS